MKENEPRAQLEIGESVFGIGARVNPMGDL
jgi:hypothetical protein